MVTNRYREINRRYEKNHAACFYQQRRLITATIQFFDLFSGIGGFREGLRRAGGFTCVGHCEVDTYADKNYRLLFDTEGEWYCSDARTIEPERMPDFDLLCAGFPCQAFSIAGKREGFADARGTLFFEIARLLKAKRPQYFILENVPGLLSHDKGRTFCTILSTLSQLGYHVEWKVLNSKDFGVPQARKRVYIVGYLDFRCAGKILPEPETNGAALVQIRAGSQGKRVYSPKGLSCTLTSQAGGMGGKTGLYDVGVPIKENTKLGYKLAREGDSIDLGYANLNSRRGRVGHQIAHTLTNIIAPATAVYSLLHSITGSIGIILASVWQIPLCLYLARKTGMFVPIVLNTILGIVLSTATALGNTIAWWFVPYCWAAKLAEPLMGIEMNGTYAGNCGFSIAIMISILLSILLFLILSYADAKDFSKGR